MEAETAYRLALARESYGAGFADGYAAACRDADRVWSSQPPARITFAPCSHELEERRWGPGGREHFADTRPTDRFPKEAA